MGSNYTDAELMERMTEALQDAIEVQKRYEEVLNRTVEENNYLTGFIIENRLSERYIKYRVRK